MSLKIIGYLFLFTGTLSIILSVVSVYAVFIHRIKPIQAFSLSGFSLDLSKLQGYSLPGQTTEAKTTEILSSTALNDIANISTHIFLMTLVASAGFKIASIGTQLLRPIEVQLKSVESSKPSGS